MKKLLIVICTLAFGLVAVNADALSLTQGDSRFVGSINDGIPSSPSAEVGYINNLITLSPGAGDTTIGTETYNRVGSTLANPLPTASTTLAFKDETAPFSFSGPTAFPTYILGKYDAAQAGSLVWLVPAGSTDITVPGTFNGHGISHLSAYTTGTALLAPDGGATIGLLGLAMLGLGYLRRRME